MMEKRPADEFREMIARSRRVVFLTGAGISTESGIPDFRSAGGIYSDPAKLAIFDIDSFHRDPGPFWRFSAEFLPLLERARPNTAHLAIARLGEMKEVEVATQNIDDLHLKAGSRTVWRLHGSFETSSCLRCGRKVRTAELRSVILGGGTPKDECGGVFKPEVTFFGEMLPVRELENSLRAAAAADLFCVVGSSLAVYPAASIPHYRRPGCPLVIVNRDPTPLDAEADLVIRASVGEAFSEIGL